MKKVGGVSVPGAHAVAFKFHGFLFFLSIPSRRPAANDAAGLQPALALAPRHAGPDSHTHLVGASLNGSAAVGERGACRDRGSAEKAFNKQVRTASPPGEL